MREEKEMKLRKKLMREKKKRKKEKDLIEGNEGKYMIYARSRFFLSFFYCSRSFLIFGENDIIYIL